MPRPRIPAAVAHITGAALKDPARYRPPAPVSNYLGPIGGPPGWLSEPQTNAWNELVETLPWLDRSHGGIVGIAAVLIARLRAGDASVSELNLLRLCLGQLGATPADARRVAMPVPESDDPAEEFFR